MNDNTSTKTTQLNEKIFRLSAYNFFICQYRHRRFKRDLINDTTLNNSVSKAIKSIVDRLDAQMIYDDGSPIDAESISQCLNEILYRYHGDLVYLENMPELKRQDIRALQITYAVNHTKELPQEFLSNKILNANSIKDTYEKVNHQALELVNKVSSKYGLFICDLIRSIFNDLTKINNLTINELDHSFYPYPELKFLLAHNDNINKLFTSDIKLQRSKISLDKMIKMFYSYEEITAKSMTDFNLNKNEIPTYIQILDILTPAKFHVDSILNRKYGLLLWDRFRYSNTKNKKIEEYIKELYDFHIDAYKNDNKNSIDFKRQCFKWLENAEACIDTGNIIPIK